MPDNHDMKALIGFFEGQVTGWTNLVRESNATTAKATESVLRIEGRLDSLEKTIEGFRKEVEAAKKLGSPEGQAALLRARSEFWRTMISAIVGAVVTLAIVFGLAKYTQAGHALVGAPQAPAAPARAQPPAEASPRAPGAPTGAPPSR